MSSCPGNEDESIKSTISTIGGSGSIIGEGDILTVEDITDKEESDVVLPPPPPPPLRPVEAGEKEVDEDDTVDGSGILVPVVCDTKNEKLNVDIIVALDNLVIISSLLVIEREVEEEEEAVRVRIKDVEAVCDSVVIRSSLLVNMEEEEEKEEEEVEVVEGVIVLVLLLILVVVLVDVDVHIGIVIVTETGGSSGA